MLFPQTTFTFNQAFEITDCLSLSAISLLLIILLIITYLQMPLSQIIPDMGQVYKYSLSTNQPINQSINLCQLTLRSIDT